MYCLIAKIVLRTYSTYSTTFYNDIDTVVQCECQFFFTKYPSEKNVHRLRQENCVREMSNFKLYIYTHIYVCVRILLSKTKNMYDALYT